MLKGHGKHAPFSLVLHWTTLTEPQTEAAWQALLDKMNTYNLGYNAAAWNGEVRWMTPEGERAYHAGGSPGLKDANRNSFGLTVPYISPSFSPRGISGEVELPFTQRTEHGDKERTAWYPPIDGDMLRECVLWSREVFIRNGWDRVCFWTHASISPRKNDVRNLGVNTFASDGYLVTHGELNALFTE